MMPLLILLSVIGLVSIFYNMYVEFKVKQDPSYRSLCDFNEHLSCTRTMTSRWERALFGIPNSLVGIGYYFLFIILVFAGKVQLAFYLALITSSLVLLVMVLILRTEKVLCTICTFQWFIMILQALLIYVHP